MAKIFDSPLVKKIGKIKTTYLIIENCKAVRHTECYNKNKTTSPRKIPAVKRSLSFAVFLYFQE